MAFKKAYLKTIETRHATEADAHKAAKTHFKSFTWWKRILFLTTRHYFEYKYFQVTNIRGSNREFYYV